jgi:hypothetical protein
MTSCYNPSADTVRAIMFRRSPLVIALLLLANAAVARWHYASVALDIDYFTLWSVPHLLSAGPLSAASTTNIYRTDTQRQMAAALLDEARSGDPSSLQSRVTALTASLSDNRLDVTGTPFAYAMAGLFSSGDFARDVMAFHWLSLICFLSAIGILLWMLRFSLAGAVVCLVFFGFEFTPIRADVRVANVNQIQLLALALFILLSSKARPMAAGMALGLGIAIKPNLLAVAGMALLFGLAARHYKRTARTVFGVGLATATAVVASALYFDRLTVWRDFVRSVPDTLGRGYLLASGNYGFAELVSTMTSVPLAPAVVVLLFTALVAVLSLTRRKEANNGDRDWPFHESFLVVGSGCALMLLGSRLAWLHYYALTIPIALYLLRPEDGAEAQRRHRTLGWCLAVVALCCLTDAAQQLTTPFAESVLANTAALLLFAGSAHSTWWMRATSTGSVAASRPKDRGRGGAAARPRRGVHATA